MGEGAAIATMRSSELTARSLNQPQTILVMGLIHLGKAGIHRFQEKSLLAVAVHDLEPMLSRYGVDNAAIPVVVRTTLRKMLDADWLTRKGCFRILPSLRRLKKQEMIHEVRIGRHTRTYPLEIPSVFSDKLPPEEFHQLGVLAPAMRKTFGSHSDICQ